jgi:hypothetical protein
MNQILDFFAPLARDRMYHDPGSGSILLQMVIAAALGAAFAVKVYWKKIKGALSKKKIDPESSGQTDSPESIPGEKPE